MPPTRREVTTAGTRRALVESAIACFSTAGYEATSILQLTQRAGVSKGAFYKHFPDKRSIFIETFVQRLQAAAQLLQDAYASLAGRPYGDGVEVMAIAASQFSLLSVTDLVHRELLRQAPEVLGNELHTAIDDEYVLPPLLSLMKALHDRGELAPDLPLETAAALLLRTACGGNTLVAAAQEPESLVLEILVTLGAFFRGLVAPELQPRLAEFIATFLAGVREARGQHHE